MTTPPASVRFLSRVPGLVSVHYRHAQHEIPPAYEPGQLVDSWVVFSDPAGAVEDHITPRTKWRALQTTLLARRPRSVMWRVLQLLLVLLAVGGALAFAVMFFRLVFHGGDVPKALLVMPLLLIAILCPLSLAVSFNRGFYREQVIHEARRAWCDAQNDEPLLRVTQICGHRDVVTADVMGLEEITEFWDSGKILLPPERCPDETYDLAGDLLRREGGPQALENELAYVETIMEGPSEGFRGPHTEALRPRIEDLRKQLEDYQRSVQELMVVLHSANAELRGEKAEEQARRYLAGTDPEGSTEA